MPKAKYKPEENIKSIDQLSMAKLVATKLGLSLSTVIEVVELEQKLTMQHVKEGYKVTKKNYITFTPIKKPTYLMKSKLDGNEYQVPERMTIRAKLGLGFKAFVADGNGKMPDKICRFVDGKEEKPKPVVKKTKITT
ncbi:hypothetical protein BK010_00460 [Tenericutes bacterium MO-XQ]|nr:hypothetical protein BK010_00460 [Tenericutes bacterium MO-XQ]